MGCPEGIYFKNAESVLRLLTKRDNFICNRGASEQASRERNTQIGGIYGKNNRIYIKTDKENIIYR